MTETKVALVTGVGPGLGASVCQKLCSEGYAVAGTARSPGFCQELERDLRAAGQSFLFAPCDVSDGEAMQEVVERVTNEWGAPAVLVHNAGQLVIKPFVEMTAEEFEAVWRGTALGAMIAAKAVLPGMILSGEGTILFTGATASMRGSANFAALASAKFALRGLAQSLAREHGPLGIHIVHAVLDGIMWGGISKAVVNASRETCIEPDAVAEIYLQLIRQERSAWTHEIDIRPSSETF